MFIYPRFPEEIFPKRNQWKSFIPSKEQQEEMEKSRATIEELINKRPQDADETDLSELTKGIREMLNSMGLDPDKYVDPPEKECTNEEDNSIPTHVEHYIEIDVEDSSGQMITFQVTLQKAAELRDHLNRVVA